MCRNVKQNVTLYHNGFDFGSELAAAPLAEVCEQLTARWANRGAAVVVMVTDSVAKSLAARVTLGSTQRTEFVLIIGHTT